MNEAKQKAKELVDKFLPFVKSEIYQRENAEVKNRVESGESFKDLVNEGYLNSAKQCALIACDFTIERLTPWKNTYSGRKQIEEIQSVKQEITKLT